jgi:hypothetical protein
MTTARQHSQDDESLEGIVPESWHCVDCNRDTAPGFFSRADMEKAIAALGEKWRAGEGLTQTIDADTEIFHVRAAAWKAARMAPMGGCLCIRCLEKRLGRQLRPKDFVRGHEFNNPWAPGTELRMARLLAGKRR